jgi:nucleoside-diphosphate-sugar epimerase
LSTAFAGGYCYQTIPEAPLSDPPSDPTDYTRTKRMGEYQVVEGGIPYLILRPSIVIGDSRTGYYPGKPYGIYQVIRAGESFLTQIYLEKLHLLAPKYPLPLLHQDAFQEGFFASYQHSPHNSFINLVSEHGTLPTTRDLWRFWVENLLQPQEVVYYERKDQIDFERLTLQEKAVIEFSSVNFEIASNPWIFQRDALNTICTNGYSFMDATPQTLDICQSRFLKDSEKLQKYLKDFFERFPGKRMVVEK